MCVCMGKCGTKGRPCCRDKEELRIVTFNVDNFQSSWGLLQKSFCGDAKEGAEHGRKCPILNLADTHYYDPTRFKNKLWSQIFKAVPFEAWLSVQPPDTPVIFLDGGDVGFVGCGADSPQRPPPASTLATLRRRLLSILARSNATVVFGAEFTKYDMNFRMPEPPLWAQERCPARIDPGKVAAALMSAGVAVDRDYTSCNSKFPNHCSSAYRPILKYANAGLVAGRAADLLPVVRAILRPGLSGSTDQGRYLSYFLSPTSHPHGRMTLDYCGMAHMYTAALHT